ncbi:AGAP007315-PA-like protein [Anopheles sinensis]|uniref:AGAP007315-PA-like protein n=1 Tax=Anopheles sinensis TaxID=74873 RepID=A0A084VQN8_ANOSI|nr:AGAP007315-PA-like protein [Anopheles sinensis]
MDSKFYWYIKFNGYLILIVTVFKIFVGILEWIRELESGESYGYALSTLRNNVIVDGVFLLAWIIAVASLYQAISLEVVVLLYPIGYLLGLEALIVAAQDSICWWTNNTEESFLPRSSDAFLWIGKA